jgi:hypothetical protein
MVNYCQMRYINPSRSLSGVHLTVAGCGKITTGEMPSVLHTSDLKVIKTKTCMDIVEYLGGERLIISDKFICTVGLPYTFLEVVSNSEFYSNYVSK